MIGRPALAAGAVADLEEGDILTVVHALELVGWRR